MVDVRIPQQGRPAPLPRCCAQHTDWETLAEHLLREFEGQHSEVLRELDRAAAGIALLELGEPDALWIAELIVRNQMMLLRGEAPEARLDPESHPGRARRG